MEDGCLLRIRVYVGDQKNWFSRTLYQEIVHHLWEWGAPGITVFGDIEGLDTHGRLQRVDSDYAANVPITLEVYGTKEEIDGVYRAVSTKLPGTSRVLVISNVQNVKGETNVQVKSTMDTAEADENVGCVLRVYMKEEDKHQHLPLYHALLIKLKKLNVLWVDVQHALEGFGADHVVRKASFFSFSSQEPMVLEATLPFNSVKKILHEIQPMLEKASGPAFIFKGTILKGNRGEET